MIKIMLLGLFLFNSLQVFANNYDIEAIEFTSHGEKLSGSIVIPKHGKIYAAIVFVHGSGKQTRNMHWAERFASEGIIALVYDKRGTGSSGGKYQSRQSVSEKNIRLLADDSIAALMALRHHHKTTGLPLGLTGISQAGWIIPLAATQSNDVDFIALWSGPVCKVSEEDIFSRYTADSDSSSVPAYSEALQSRTETYIWPDFLGEDTDPSKSLATLDIPGLWVFGAQDGSIPVDLSMQRLKQLIQLGQPYEYALFSALGHNNMSETFSVVSDWIKRLPIPTDG